MKLGGTHQRTNRTLPTARWRFRTSAARGYVKAEKEHYGVYITVKEGKRKWGFLLDLFYLAKAADEVAVASGDPRVKPCVQVVCYNPLALDEDPVKHVRVFQDGGTEVFDA